MNGSVVGVLLLALAGFLAGGVVTTWRAGNRGSALVLAAAAGLATGGAVAWLL